MAEYYKMRRARSESRRASCASLPRHTKGRPLVERTALCLNEAGDYGLITFQNAMFAYCLPSLLSAEVPGVNVVLSPKELNDAACCCAV